MRGWRVIDRDNLDDHLDHRSDQCQQQFKGVRVRVHCLHAKTRREVQWIR
jgi:hypothetical protein